MKEHFEHHFYNKNHQTIDTSKGEKQPFNLPISLEFKIAIKKLNNNRVTGLDEIAAEAGQIHSFRAMGGNQICTE